MTIIIIGRYREDRNASTIAYKVYQHTHEDKYPTFTLCLKGDDLYRYNTSAIFEAYEINPREYKLLLQGKPASRYNYDVSRKLYEKTSLPLAYKTNFTYEEMVQSSHYISDIVKEATFEAADADYSIFYGEMKHLSETAVFTEMPPLYNSYQTSKMKCFTRKSRDISDLIRRRDHLHLDLSFLHSSTLMELFIHYPGQLMRHVDNPSLTIFSGDMKKHNYQIKLSQNTVLRKRSTKREACINNIVDYDLYLQNAISNELHTTLLGVSNERKAIP